MEEATVSINRKGEVVEFDTGAVALFGFSAEHAIGKQLSELLIRPRDRDTHERGFMHFLRSGQANMFGHPIDLILMHQDGSEVRAQIRLHQDESDGHPIYRSIITAI